VSREDWMPLVVTAGITFASVAAGALFAFMTAPL